MLFTGNSINDLLTEIEPLINAVLGNTETCCKSKADNAKTESGPLKLKIDLPGVAKEDITLSYDSYRLTVEFVLDGKEYAKHVQINEGYDINKVTTSYKDGRLNITIPELEKKTTKINIKIQ